MSDLEIESDIDFYAQTVHGLKLDAARKKDLEAPVTPTEFSALQEVNGQLNWLARQGRVDVAYGVSRSQQALCEAQVKDIIDVWGSWTAKSRTSRW